MLRLNGILLLMAVFAAAATAQTASRITRIEFSPVEESEGGGVFVALVGTGSCTYTIDYGDGTTERRTATLPDRVKHGFAPDREYTVVATPEAPCEGVARARLDIRAITRGIWRVALAATAPGAAPEVTATIEGRGSCAVTVAYGDGATQTITGELPAKITHTYEKSGTYDLRATAAPPCRGDVQLKVEIR